MQIHFKENIPLKNYTTYAVGGNAKRLIEVFTIEELVEVISLVKGERYIVIGKGSNILFDDEGFDGTVIINKIQIIEWKEKEINVSSGYSFSHLGSLASRNSLTGLEFAAGIPGTVGGAIFMNAGADQMETKDVLKSVTFLHPNGKIQEFPREELTFSYRKSCFQEMPGVILSAVFALNASEGASEKVKKIVDYRIKTQPYRSKSCGCTFKNPGVSTAGKLIDDCGLKGFKIGGAMVSDLHANFIVNENNATTQNILDLIKYVQVKVYLQKGVFLETEVMYIPFQEGQDC